MVCKECGEKLEKIYGLNHCDKCGYIYRNNMHNNENNFDVYDFLFSSMDVRNTSPRDEDSNEAKHKKLCEELNSTYKAKNKDYGNSFTKTFDEFGYTMSAIRLQDKLERFKKLISSTTQEVKDESIRDTLMDLANYSLMTVMELDKNE